MGDRRVSPFMDGACLTFCNAYLFQENREHLARPKFAGKRGKNRQWTCRACFKFILSARFTQKETTESGFGFRGFDAFHLDDCE